jgi:mRNA interferase HigB
LEVHADSEQQLKSWFQETSNAGKSKRTKKKNIQARNFLNNNRVVFNIKEKITA